MKKVILIILLIAVLTIGYFYKDNSVNNNLNKDVDVNDKVENKDDICLVDDGCIIIDDIKYNIDKQKEITITDMYNYDNSHMEAGYLKIVDDRLVFLSLDEKILKSFDNIEGKIKYIVSSSEECNDKFYAVITDAGKVYRNDAGSSLFQENPFYLVETASHVKDILIINNNDEHGNCSYETLILVLLDNSVIKLEKVD